MTYDWLAGYRRDQPGDVPRHLRLPQHRLLELLPHQGRAGGQRAPVVLHSVVTSSPGPVQRPNHNPAYSTLAYRMMIGKTLATQFHSSTSIHNIRLPHLSQQRMFCFDPRGWRLLVLCVALRFNSKSWRSVEGVANKPVNALLPLVITCQEWLVAVPSLETGWQWKLKMELEAFTTVFWLSQSLLLLTKNFKSLWRSYCW